MSSSRILAINFKTYESTAGKKGVLLAKKLTKLGKNVVVCVSALHLADVTKATKNRVFAQHLDTTTPGRNTGFLCPYHAKKVGAAGTILNHSEHPIKLKTLKETIKQCKKVKLTTIVCAPNLRMIKKIAHLHPDYIAYEPPALIGGNLSVTEANPRIIQQAVELTKKFSRKTKVLCGAGVKTAKDVKHAIDLGCVGVLIASGIVKARDPVRVAKTMVDAI